MSVLSRPEFHSEEAAFEYLEGKLWSECVVCVHCGGMDRITKVKANPEKRIRLGLWRCGDCKKQFTVKVGTVFEHMRLPLNKALQAVFLMTSSKKGVSAHQLHRMLEITYKSAWFLAHRIREAMRDGQLAVPFGSDGGAVEVDETYIGVLKGQPIRQSGAHKMKVISLVDRNSGQIRSYTFDQMINCYVEPVVKGNIAKEARLITDQARIYKPIGKHFASHATVNHSIGEYVRGDVYTNTVEGSFSIFKRGMKGVYQHCGEQHLHRYLAEFDFRYSNRAKLGINDAARADRALMGIVGKRLTYRRLDLHA
ncbi:IS1595 family transposase [Sphingomonas sp. SRS2]|uniref:IS1595 family transposase n=1 Tax=Sphingomonas sp. SRS2 TaxID=133190 RepID=UPI0006184315|nr:IS1595 family transposase [Sphingomonas sp. SRS2]KKC27970.1 transposase [Sphingomonas sp. SRS2]